MIEEIVLYDVILLFIIVQYIPLSHLGELCYTLSFTLKMYLVNKGTSLEPLQASGRSSQTPSADRFQLS